MNLDYLVQRIREVVGVHPELKPDLYEFYQMAQDEINDGESEEHEVELALNSIKELLEERGLDNTFQL